VPARIDDQIEASLRALAETAILQSRRLLERTRTDPGYEMSAKDLAGLVKNLVQIKILVLESRQRLEGSDEIEAAERLVQELTEDEQRVLLKLASRST
jgi:hypothetical protein